MRAPADTPRRPLGRSLVIAGAIAIVFVAWGTGAFDRFFAQLGLDFMVAGTCIRTMADTLMCGADEVGRWCQQFGTLSADNKALCVGHTR